MKLNELMCKAILTWGEESQIKMAVEECAELLVAIMHRSRNRVTNKAVVEELVDVSLMVEQLRMIYDKDGDFETIRTQKLERLEKLLYPKRTE